MATGYTCDITKEKFEDSTDVKTVFIGGVKLMQVSNKFAEGLADVLHAWVKEKTVKVEKQAPAKEKAKEKPATKKVDVDEEEEANENMNAEKPDEEE